MPNRYVLTLCPASGGDAPDLTALRGRVIADAHARFLQLRGDDVVLAHGGAGAAAGEPLGALAIGGTVAAGGDPAVERWAHWLIERLDAAGRVYKREGEGWRLRTGDLHAESERRLDELSGWNDAALAGQRELLRHVDDPGDSGSELEQSLSKLAAAGWKVDAKKDKGPPEVHFAAGDMPLANGDDWRASGAVHPRLAAALGLLLAATPAEARGDSAPAEELVAELARRLPAVAVAASGDGTDTALLDLRAVAKALRDVGGLDLPDGEPLRSALVIAPFSFGEQPRPAVAAEAPTAGPAPAAAAASAPAGAALNGAAPDRGGDAMRFALLHAAAPAKPFAGGEDVVGYAAAFLAEVAKAAAARLDGSPAGMAIDPGDDLRRRLAGWCDTAVARTAENHERLDLHLATRNAIRLLARIKAFETRIVERRGEVAGADREAIAVALALLAQLLGPLAPEAADDVWRRAGRDGSAGDASWPSAQRELATA